MDIACPNCGAAYRVPDAVVAQGKPLRCAACGHRWRPGAPEEAAAPAPPPPVAAAEPVAAPLVPPRPPRTPRGAALLPLAWGGSLLALGALIGALVRFRAEIAEAWPPFARLLPLLGG